VYKPGASNKVADALSRRLEEEEDRVMEINVLSIPYWRDIELVEEQKQQDLILKKIMEEFKNNPEAHRNYTLESGRLRGEWYYQHLRVGFPSCYTSIILFI